MKFGLTKVLGFSFFIVMFTYFFLKLRWPFKVERNVDMALFLAELLQNFQTEGMKFSFAASNFSKALMVRDNNFALVICSDKVSGRDCVDK